MNYELADHLLTPRLAYTHHGLYAGGGEVLEYSQKGVNLTSLDEFSEGHGIYVESHLARRYSREESIQRGISRLGEDKYNVIFRNCERFVYWCIDGLPYCDQIEGRILRIVGELANGYMTTRRLPPSVIEFLAENPLTGRKLISIFGNNEAIFNILRPALGQSNLPCLTSFIASTLSPVSSVAVSAVRASAIAGTLAAPVVASVGAAAAVGNGVKKIVDFFL